MVDCNKGFKNWVGAKYLNSTNFHHYKFKRFISGFLANGQKCFKDRIGTVGKIIINIL